MLFLVLVAADGRRQFRDCGSRVTCSLRSSIAKNVELGCHEC